MEKKVDRTLSFLQNLAIKLEKIPIKEYNTTMEYDQFVIDMLAQAEDLKIKGEFEEAITILQKIVLHEPQCFEAFEELGDNFLSLKRFKESEKALREAIRLSKKSANAHYLLGFLLSQQQQWEASVKELQEADFQSPNHPEILRCLGWSYHNQNRKSAQGIALMERSQSLSPNDPNILCDLGVCYMNSKQHNRAQQVFRRVIEIAPHSDQAQECRNFLNILKHEEDSQGK